MSVVDETVFAFNSEYNLGKESAKSLIHYCRPAVEKYVFSKVRIKLLMKHSCMISYLQCTQLRMKKRTGCSLKDPLG